MDFSELYDHEYAQVGKIWAALTQKYSRRTNSAHNLSELAREAKEEFFKVGLVVDVKWEQSLMINPNTMMAYPIELNVLGRVPGAHYEEEGTPMLDHEKKRDEVLKANARGEKFLGQKGN